MVAIWVICFVTVFNIFLLDGIFCFVWSLRCNMVWTSTCCYLFLNCND
jgi:hypothetical protein